MSTHATARHRASTPVKTPLTPLSLALPDGLRGSGRRGLVVVASSGLLANLALPGGPTASAAPGQTDPAIPVTASIDLTSVQAADPGALRVVTAPAEASVQVESPPLTAAANQPTGTTVQERISLVAASAPVTAKAAPAKAATTTTAAKTSVAKTTSTAATAAPKTLAARGAAVLSIAARYVGVYYRYGGTTPKGFDCSGYVQYVYRQLGIKLPRTADQQMRATKRISRSEARPGDLVSFVTGGYAHHIAIYAGNGMIYDSPHTGKAISLRKLWTANVVYTRVLG